MDPVVDIVCYGIGRIASCPIARYQFAFLLLLREILQVNYMYHSKFNWHLEMNEWRPFPFCCCCCCFLSFVYLFDATIQWTSLHISRYIGTCAVFLYLKMIHMMCLQTFISDTYFPDSWSVLYIWTSVFTRWSRDSKGTWMFSNPKQWGTNFYRKMFRCHKVQCETKK